MGYNENIILLTLKRDKVNQVRVDMGNPGYLQPGKYIEKISPVIQQNTPEVLQKPGEMALASTEIYEEMTKISKPV